MSNVPGQTPTAEGSLDKTPLVHLLVYLADRRLSGTMVFGGRSLDDGDAVLFADGAPSKVKTVDRVAELGRVLVEMGAFEPSTLDASLLTRDEDQPKDGASELYGEYLVRTGVVDRPALLAALHEQTERKLGHLFALPNDTTYAFFQDKNLLEDWGGPELTSLDVLPTIWRAVCARAHEPIIDATLSRLGNTVLKLHEKSDVTRFGFSPHELSIIDFLRARPSRLSKLIESQLLPERTTRLVMYALVVTRHIDHGEGGALPVGALRTKVAIPPAATVTVPSTPVVTVPPASAANGPPSGSVALARVKLTSRRIEAPVDERPREVVPLSPELSARRDAITARAATVDREDYFSILGVARTACDAEIQGAYYALAKTWHPDRLPPGLELARDKVTKVFARMSEAYETLSDGARRQRYLEMLKVGTGTPEEADQVQSIMEAAACFQRAEILWRNRDVAGAEPYILRAYASDPKQSDYAALYAMLQLSKRPPEAPVDDLIKLCDDAISQTERCERAYFCRAMLKKRQGKTEAAIADFRATYALNANNLEAAREVRVFEMRRSKQPERRSTPAARRSTPPPSVKPGSSRPSLAAKKASLFPKDGGVLSGLGKLFKR